MDDEKEQHYDNNSNMKESCKGIQKQFLK